MSRRNYRNPLTPPYRAPERPGHPPPSTFFTLQKHHLAATRGPVWYRGVKEQQYYGNALTKWQCQVNPSKLVNSPLWRKRTMMTLETPVSAVVEVTECRWDAVQAQRTMQKIAADVRVDRCLIRFQNAFSRYTGDQMWVVALFNAVTVGFWLPYVVPLLPSHHDDDDDDDDGGADIW
ncbi:hypothetical protein BZA05DRAFT_457089 [Tricharina praecox]|uniref:uncharacterized protein n=1 Tax=Tricharina praecox TaxID=43433 RepID=UPI00221E813E|nr:uncharacterized protein BZA05DRAFT_457089 [Tricharina praecox]KAI5858152.1 hypothetical protein BZA05DRAFT_457089 [Tricharina praecox]